MRCWIAMLALSVCAWLIGCGSVDESSPEGPIRSGEVGATDSAPPEATVNPGVVESEAELGWRLPIPTLPYNAREGRSLFLHYCAPCHGEDGGGDGFNAYNLDPKPRDLSAIAFQGNRTDEELVVVIRGGGAAAGLSTAMPPWGRTLNERQVEDVVQFIRTLSAQGEVLDKPEP